MPAVLILGAGGGFGQRICRMLASSTDLPLIAAGRDQGRLQAALLELPRDRVQLFACDATNLERQSLRDLGVAVLIDTVGPFQGRDRRLARECAHSGVHYLDLADDRQFVTCVLELDALAKANNVLVVSGASTLPALSCAVVDDLAQGFAQLQRIDIGIAPGYRGPRGLATIRSILSYVGRPIPVWRNGRQGAVLGWGERLCHEYPPPVGKRDLSLVDVPDTALLPSRYQVYNTWQYARDLRYLSCIEL